MRVDEGEDEGENETRRRRSHEIRETRDRTTRLWLNIRRRPYCTSLLRATTAVLRSGYRLVCLYAHPYNPV